MSQCNILAPLLSITLSVFLDNKIVKIAFMNKVKENNMLTLLIYDPVHLAVKMCL